MVKITKINNPHLNGLQSAILVRISKDKVAAKVEKESSAKKSAETKECEPVEEEAFEIEACSDFLVMLSPYFAQLLSDESKIGEVLELSEEDPEAAARLIVFMHSLLPYPETWNAVEAKLAAKWIVTSLIRPIKDYIDKFLANACSKPTGWEAKGSDKTEFLEIKQVVITHAAYQGANRYKTYGFNRGNKVMIGKLWGIELN